MTLGKRSFVLLGGAVIIALVIGVGVFLPRLTAPAADLGTLELATVRRGALLATVSATGAISPMREAQMAFTATGPLTKLGVKQGDRVKKDQLVAALDPRTLELALAQAEANLAAAQAKLDQLKSPVVADVTAAQASVASAEAALTQLRAPAQNDLVIAKTDLDKAQAAVARAQADYDRIGGASNPFSALTPQALALQQATLDYQKAVALYNAKITPTDSQLKQAQANVEQARSQLQRLTNPNPNDLKSAQANVEQARLARDLAQARVDDALIRAPFDGVVTHVDFDLGSFVPAGRVVLGIADVSELHIKLNIDETDIAKIAVGQPVTITLDAYPDANIAATVSEVAAVATTVQGVVNYVVTVTVNPGAVPLKIGMTADANIVVAQKTDVLLVPNRAVRAANDKRYVVIQKEPGKSEEIQVQLGMANEQETEVYSGLHEGQTVIISLIQNLGSFGPPR